MDHEARENFVNGASLCVTEK